jgi:hypothetical protein
MPLGCICGGVGEVLLVVGAVIISLVAMLRDRCCKHCKKRKSA